MEQYNGSFHGKGILCFGLAICLLRRVQTRVHTSLSMVFVIKPMPPEVVGSGTLRLPHVQTAVACSDLVHGGRTGCFVTCKSYKWVSPILGGFPKMAVASRVVFPPRNRCDSGN